MKGDFDMTDTEKRAHDLALLYIQGQIDRNIVEIHNTRIENVKDFSMNYTDIYTTILEHLNQNLL